MLTLQFKPFYYLIFIACPLIFLGQNSKENNSRASINVVYAQKYLFQKTGDGSFNDLSKIPSSGSLSYLGIEVNTYMLITRGVFDHPGSIGYTQVLPQVVKINDSLNATAGGFNFSYTLWGFDIFETKRNFDILINFGFNTGRVKLTGSSDFKQKNPYFAPKIMLTTRGVLGRIALSCQVVIDADITNPNWKKRANSDAPKIYIASNNLSGLSLQAGIGYVFGKD